MTTNKSQRNIYNALILKSFQMIFNTIFCYDPNVGCNFTTNCLCVITQKSTIRVCMALILG